MKASNSPYLTAKEAAEYCRLSYSRFTTLQAEGKTPALRGGRTGRKLYVKAALDKWLGVTTAVPARRRSVGRVTEAAGAVCGGHPLTEQGQGEPPVPYEPTPGKLSPSERVPAPAEATGDCNATEERR